ncbi:MAG: tRNA (adenosine(37)-N6)-threonylcarbamoyltransferase complex transferase subunit TsaD [Bacteroidales bacterium]|nr:tRNA (adenosine(37)-N6)-threonylcarbamoyltransferase complex transferase subunit TsaD [Bacteroidales bacterium]
MPTYILGIESSCDDTSAAVLQNTTLLSNVIASQKVHAEYGGVVPELASRAHQQNIIPVIDTALKRANIKPSQLSAIAYTNGPGLLGSLLVGSSFAKAMAYSLDIPLIEVNHLQGHVLAIFLDKLGAQKAKPQFPFLCLTVSGGHTQILKVHDYFDMEILGTTIDDAAGEAFDKAAKILGLPYPGGPHIDKLAQQGDPEKYTFATAHLPNFDFSFSGLKTSFLYFIRDNLKENPNFIEENKADLAASMQRCIIKSLASKLEKAINAHRCKDLVLAGGVSANSGLRNAMTELAAKKKVNLFLPDFDLTTDNAAMIALCGYFKYVKGEFSSLNAIPYSNIKLSNH